MLRSAYRVDPFYSRLFQVGSTKIKKDPLRSPLRNGSLLEIAYLRYNRGDRSVRFCWKPARALPFVNRLPPHRQPLELSISSKFTERYWPEADSPD